MDTRPALAPHRPLFLAGGLLWAAGALWWAAQTLWPSAAATLPGTALHGALMSLSFMPCFIAGFAFTAAPRWLGLPPVDGRHLRGATLCLLGGWLLALAAAQVGAALAAAGGLVMAASGLAALSLRLLRLCRGRRSSHALALASGLVWISLCVAVAALALGQGNALLLRAATLAGLYFGVGGVFVVALQRLTPFLHQHKQRRAPLLPALLAAGLALRGGLHLLALWLWPLPAWLAAPAALACAALAALLLHAAFRAELAAARRTPLVAQLHLGFVWLGLSFALDAAALLQRLPAAAGLHALTLGFMGTTMLAMVSRVCAVQHGRSVAVDRVLWSMQCLLQCVVIARLMAAVRPGMLAAAAAGFALLALAWALRYAPWLLRGWQVGPRIAIKSVEDSSPGQAGTHSGRQPEPLGSGQHRVDT